MIAPFFLLIFYCLFVNVLQLNILGALVGYLEPAGDFLCRFRFIRSEMLEVRLCFAFCSEWFQ